MLGDDPSNHNETGNIETDCVYALRPLRKLHDIVWRGLVKQNKSLFWSVHVPNTNQATLQKLPRTSSRDIDQDFWLPNSLRFETTFLNVCGVCSLRCHFLEPRRGSVQDAKC